MDPRIGSHSKVSAFIPLTLPIADLVLQVISLPLGVKARLTTWRRARMFLALNITKTRLLTINNSGWGSRTMINEMVSRAFNYTVRNTYDRKAAQRSAKRRVKFTSYNSSVVVSIPDDHLLEIVQSKYVLCPSGLGFDTYRLWEALLLGAVPVVESNPGMDRAYASLPVLVVRNFDQVTPQLLESAYDCFLRHADDFRFEHLREDYWIKLVHEALRTGNADHIMTQHPFRHKHCDFLP